MNEYNFNLSLGNDALSSEAFAAESSTLWGYKPLAYEKTIVLYYYIYPGISISTTWCSLPPGNELHAPNVGTTLFWSPMATDPDIG